MRKVVIAIDSFKGSLSSIEAGEAVRNGIVSVMPDCETILLPIGDGGDGVLETLVSALNGKYIPVKVHNPLMETIESQYGISGDGKTALIEMAAASGLTLVAADKRNPWLTTTLGTGELIKDALNKGCRDFIIGIGGSATNDAGLGMLQALGFRFLDKDGNELGSGGKIMQDVVDVDTSNIHPALKNSQFTVACDVNNPFYGKQGAASIFASQKGADDKMVELLDEGMQSLSEAIYRITGKDISNYPGAGAAGGMGGGFIAFLNAHLKPGIKLLLETIEFDKKIEGADLIITGEGKIDKQTAMGKVPFGILEEAKKQNIPVIAIAGGIENVPELNRIGFKGVFSVTPAPISLEKAMKPETAKQNIRNFIMQLFSVMQ